ncbi:hypothetical protein CGZ95_20535 [Enemella evansiae]|uniref:hypothetical protein n=1 Tax=Enemella evansiae TaxID=2016499 RepID=UPI000B969E41|nr:hypothetical protein [Enemella evansiae]OYN93044.1 hypothetical protein CGZ95_20535 [Enemella evansiae]
MSEPQPGEWPSYSARHEDDDPDEVISDPPRRQPGTVRTWVLVTHLTIIGLTMGYVLGRPDPPAWLVVIGLIAAIVAAALLIGLWVPAPGRTPGTYKKSKGQAPLLYALLAVFVVAPPFMLSVSLSELYALTVLRPTEATVLTAERAWPSSAGYTREATIDLGDGRPHRVRLYSPERDLNERVTVYADPTGIAAPRGTPPGLNDVTGPAIPGLPGLIFGWYVVIRHLRRTRPATAGRPDNAARPDNA